MAADSKVALVTGAGGGLGRAAAIALARRGCRIAMADIDPTGMAETARDCDGALQLQTDLTRPDAAQQAVDATLERFGQLDILVNNAGYGTVEPFFDMTAASWDRTLDLNLRAVALLCAAAGRHMRDRRAGRIINITSAAARMALPNYAAYSASKAGVDSLTRAAAVALAPYGVTVNSLGPGMMDTPLQRVTEGQIAAIEGRADDMEGFLAERTRRIPLGRRVSCEEVASGIVWLALDASPYVTAERLNFSGGLDKD